MEKLLSTGRKIFKRFQPQEQVETKEIEAPVEKVVELGAGFLQLTDKRLVGEKEISEKLLESNVGWVFANVSAIAEAVSEMEFELHKVVARKGQIEFEQITTHPLLDLLDKFNEQQSTSDAIYMTQSHIELAGDTFYFLDAEGRESRIGTNIERILIVRPDKMTLKIGGADEGYAVTGYTYKDIIDNEETVVEYKAEEILHLKNPNPSNMYRGKSVVEAAAGDIDTDTMSLELVKSFFKNSTIVNMILSTEQKMSRDDVVRIMADIKKNYQGFTKAFRAMVLSGGLEPKPANFNSKEMQLVEMQRWTRDKIMAMFKNTKTSLGITDDVNRSNAESSLLSWKQNVIKPKMTRIVDTLNEFLVPRFGNDLILGFKDPVPENREAKITEVVKLKKEANIISTDEAREMLGLDPLGGEFATISQPKTEVPAPVKNVDYKKFMRKMNVFDEVRKYKELHAQAKEIVRGIKKPVKKTEVEIRESQFFTNTEVWDYWAKQIHIVDVKEAAFKEKIIQFLKRLEDTAVGELRKQKSVKKAIDIFDVDTEVSYAIDLFTPILAGLGVEAGQEAMDLLNLDKVYMPEFDFKQEIEEQVKLFATSMVETDQKILSEIITTGVEEGQSIPQIERGIRDRFETLQKTQTEAIARSEIIRASNNSALDAFEQSEVVIAKQWLTAMDERVCPYCAPLNGKIISLKRVFFKKGQSYLGNAETALKLDYTDTKAPPLHVNCRCGILPVLKEEKALQSESELIKTKDIVENLEKDLKDKDEYIKELEKVVDE